MTDLQSIRQVKEPSTKTGENMLDACSFRNPPLIPVPDDHHI